MTRRPQISALLTLLLLIGLALWSIWMMEPPAPKPATAPPTDFSAERAFRHIRQIGREPHAMGTPGHARLRTYLLGQLRALGLEVQVQETPVSYRRGGSVGYVYNLLGRLRGKQSSDTGSRKAVLMLAHYDSQPNARGAADDGAGVAAMLETVRALQQSEPLQHDVIVLISDGEEYGLYGAQAFLRHPWAKDVGFVMNLEARGVRGAAMTFEISPENGWAVEALAKGAPYPVASSLMYEVYRSLPNSSDFTIFRNAGYTGINTAFIDGFVHYHKLTDAPQTLNLSSLQHHGSNLLGMTRYVGNQALENTKATDKVFFNTVGFHLVQYPMWLNGWFVGLLTLLLVGVFVLGLRQRVLTIWQSLAGLGLFLLILLLTTALFWPITVFVRDLMPPAFKLRIAEDSRFAFDYYINGIYGSDRFFVAYILLTVGLVGLLIRLVLRWIRPFSLLMGVYLLLYLLIVVQAIWLPAATFLLLFPCLFSLVGTLLLFSRNLVRRDETLAYRLIAGVSALPALLLLSPLVRMLFVTFDLQMPFIASMLLFILLLSLLLPLVFGLEQALRWRSWPTAALVSLGLGLLLTIWAIRAEQPSAEQPLHSQVSYYLDSDSGKAHWSSVSPHLDHWKAQFFPDKWMDSFRRFYPAGQGNRLLNQRRRLVQETTALALPAPTATIISDSNTTTGRTLRLRLHSPRGAAGFVVGFMVSDTADVRNMHINNEPVQTDRWPLSDQKGYWLQLVCNGLPTSKELTLTMKTRPKTPFRLFLYDQSMSLPESLVRVPRPADVVYEQGAGSNQTIVRKVYAF